MHSLSKVGWRSIVVLALAGLAAGHASAGCRMSSAVGSSASGISTGGSCTTASECTGPLPEECQTCPDGVYTCAHHACDDGKCEIVTCPTVPPPTCTYSGSSSTQTVSTASAVYTSTTSRGSGGTVTVATTITVGGVNYLTRQDGHTGKNVVVDTTYGALAQGVQHVHLASTDGVHFSGVIDSRSVTTTVPAAGQAESFVYADGKPAPTFTVASATQTALTALGSAVGSATCPVPTTPINPAVVGGDGGPVPVASGDGGVTPATQPVANAAGTPVSYPNPTINDDYTVSNACNNCLGNCNSTVEGCTAGTMGDCLIGLILGPIDELCGMGALIGCDLDYQSCLNDCDNAGEPCDPGNCGSTVCATASDKCTADDNCCPSENTICGNDCCAIGTANEYGCNPNATGSTGGCCPIDPMSGGWTVPCGPTCCGAGEECADPTTGACCPAGIAACGGGCCGLAGEVCAGESVAASGHADWCCPGGQGACNGDCCPTGECRQGAITTSGEECCATPLCNGQCCNGGACVDGACCFGPTDATGSCCSIDDTVVGGRCCPQGQACGSACCATGQACLNAATSQCGTPPNTCTGGKVPCQYGDVTSCCFADQSCYLAGPDPCCGGSEGPACIIP